MQKNNWLKNEWLQSAILALPFAVIAALWDKIPARIAIHWGLRGRPDGWGPKVPDIFLLPVLNLAVGGIFALLVWLDLRRRVKANPEGYDRTRQIIRQGRLLITGMLSLVSIAIVAYALGRKFNVARLGFNSGLVLILVLGNSISLLKPNLTTGIRTRWTLKSPEVWRVTHRVAGRLMVFGACALLAIECLFPFRRSCGYLSALWSH